MPFLSQNQSQGGMIYIAREYFWLPSYFSLLTCLPMQKIAVCRAFMQDSKKAHLGNFTDSENRYCRGFSFCSYLHRDQTDLSSVCQVLRITHVQLADCGCY